MNNEQLKSYYQRALNLEAEITELKEGLKELYLEVKSAGFDDKILKKIVALSKKDTDKLNEEEALLLTYMEALGLK